MLISQKFDEIKKTHVTSLSVLTVSLSLFEKTVLSFVAVKSIIIVPFYYKITILFIHKQLKITLLLRYDFCKIR